MKYKKICGCGYETTVSKEIWTKCPECGEKANWGFEIITEHNRNSLGNGDIKYTGKARDGRDKMLIQNKEGRFIIILIDKQRNKIEEKGVYDNRVDAEMEIFKL